MKGAAWAARERTGRRRGGHLRDRAQGRARGLRSTRARGLPGLEDRGDGERRDRSRRARRRGRRAHGGRVGDAREQRDRHRAARPRRRRARARACPACRGAHRRRPGAVVARPARCRGRRGSRLDLGPQVRRAQGRRRAARCATACRWCPWSTAAVTRAGDAPARRTSPGSSGSPRPRAWPTSAALPTRERIAALRDRLEQGLARTVDGFVVNGDRARRVPGIVNGAFPGVEAETLLVALDQRELYAASGSSCSSGAIDPSHVLLAMGLGDTRARAVGPVQPRPLVDRGRSRCRARDRSGRGPPARGGRCMRSQAQIRRPGRRRISAPVLVGRRSQPQ